MRVYARTREKERAWKMGSICLGGSAAAAPLVLLIFKKWHHYSFHEVGCQSYPLSGNGRLSWNIGHVDFLGNT